MVQLARALDIHPFTCLMGRKFLYPSIIQFKNPSDSTMQPAITKLIEKYSTKCNHTIIHNKCIWNCKNNPKLHLKYKKINEKSIVIPKKPIIIQYTNNFNLKKVMQCFFQPKTLQSKDPGNWLPALLAPLVLFIG